MSDHIDGIKQAITHVEDVIGRYEDFIEGAEEHLSEDGIRHANALSMELRLELGRLHIDLAEATKQEKQ